MRFKSLLMQLLMGISIRRYLPAMGTAGLLRSCVSGKSRVPRPPPRMRLSTVFMHQLHEARRSQAGDVSDLILHFCCMPRQPPCEGEMRFCDVLVALRPAQANGG